MERPRHEEEPWPRACPPAGNRRKRRHHDASANPRTENLDAARRFQGRLCVPGGSRVSGGAFDPRDVAKLPPQQLGYKADWVVERFSRYNLEWDITGLRLESLDPEAKNYPWFIVMNGGAANFYEFFVDLKNRSGWTQYLAQKLNVMIVTIPGNFKYGV